MSRRTRPQTTTSAALSMATSVVSLSSVDADQSPLGVPAVQGMSVTAGRAMGGESRRSRLHHSPEKDSLRRWFVTAHGLTFDALLLLGRRISDMQCRKPSSLHHACKFRIPFI